MGPGLTVLAPASGAELKQMLRWAVLEQDGPVAIRYPRGGDGQYQDCGWNAESGIAVHRKGTDCAIVTYGNLVNHAMEAAERLQQQGVSASVIRLTRLSHLPSQALLAALDGVKHVLIAEEAAAQASLHDSIAAFLPNHRVDFLDLGSEYMTHGDMASLYRHYGLDAHAMVTKILEVQKVEK